MNIPHIENDPAFRAIIEECDRVLTQKGHDYTQGHKTDRLRNFRRGGERLGLPARQILAVYMFKHIDAIETFLRGEALESEPIRGRIVDAINYLMLLYKLVCEEQGQADDVADAQKKVAEVVAPPAAPDVWTEESLAACGNKLGDRPLTTPVEACGCEESNELRRAMRDALVLLRGVDSPAPGTENAMRILARALRNGR